MQAMRTELGDQLYEDLVKERAYHLWRTGFIKDSQANWFASRTRKATGLKQNSQGNWFEAELASQLV
jgi:hypothetical protein